MLQRFLLRRGERAFTLVELLVVIAIIGILATIVLVSLNTARIRARDAKRLGDVRQIQLALELFADSHNQSYPRGDMYATVACPASPDDDNCGLAASNACGNKPCMSAVPADPTGNAKYWYNTPTTPATDPTLYHIAALLEEVSNSALDSDRDCTDDAGGTCPSVPYTARSAAGNIEVGPPVAPATDDPNTGCIAALSDDNRFCYDVTN